MDGTFINKGNNKDDNIIPNRFCNKLNGIPARAADKKLPVSRASKRK